MKTAEIIVKGIGKLIGFFCNIACAGFAFKFIFDFEECKEYSLFEWSFFIGCFVLTLASVINYYNHLEDKATIKHQNRMLFNKKHR